MGTTQIETKGYFISTTGDIRKHVQHRMTDVGELIGARTGFFDIVYTTTLDRVFLLWVDDTGLIDQRPINPFASLIAGRPLFGDVFITGDEDEEGRVQDLDYDAFDEWFAEGLGMTLAAE
jgi:hypothetical protein